LGFGTLLSGNAAFQISQELGQRFVKTLLGFFRNYRLAIFNPELLVHQVNPLQNIARA
jgi:hypothetical protein